MTPREGPERVPGAPGAGLTCGFLRIGPFFQKTGQGSLPEFLARRKSRRRPRTHARTPAHAHARLHAGARTCAPLSVHHPCAYACTARVCVCALTCARQCVCVRVCMDASTRQPMSPT